MSGLSDVLKPAVRGVSVGSQLLIEGYPVSDKQLDAVLSLVTENRELKMQLTQERGQAAYLMAAEDGPSRNYKHFPQDFEHNRAYDVVSDIAKGKITREAARTIGKAAQDREATESAKEQKDQTIGRAIGSRLSEVAERNEALLRDASSPFTPRWPLSEEAQAQLRAAAKIWLDHQITQTNQTYPVGIDPAIKDEDRSVPTEIKAPVHTEDSETVQFGYRRSLLGDSLSEALKKRW